MCIDDGSYVEQRGNSKFAWRLEGARRYPGAALLIEPHPKNGRKSRSDHTARSIGRHGKITLRLTNRRVAFKVGTFYSPCKKRHLKIVDCLTRLSPFF